jgi:hypothetical protein
MSMLSSMSILSENVQDSIPPRRRGAVNALGENGHDGSDGDDASPQKETPPAAPGIPWSVLAAAATG